MNTNHEAAEELRLLLLRRIKERLPELKALLASSDDHWGIEDAVYRFYHQSFKVYNLQSSADRIASALRNILPERPLNSWFQAIIAEGTGKTFDMTHNQNWLQHTRPILEAFFHAQHFLRMVCKYGETLEAPPSLMPSGWASVLYLYDLR